MAKPKDPKQCDHAEIEKTFKILDEGKIRIQLNENYKKVTLVLGNTGSGKSTVVQWIAGDRNDTLTSKEVNPDSGDFFIEDNHKRIGSSIFSQTTFPELVINKTEAYYDSPGFSDTRSTANDIANNYFIKQITDHCTDLKIVLVVNYSSVREGSDRSDFVTLLRRTTSLIKNVAKYENSFGIIVTKVDNLYKKKGTDNILTPDEKMIENIADYLKNVKEALTEKSTSGDVTKEEKAFQTKAITMLDMFLKHEKYPKIAIFRRPDEEGPLSGIQILQEGKQRVDNFLKDLKFTKTYASDFGYAISDISKNDVNALTETINNKVWTLLTEIIDQVQKHEDVFTKMSAKINSLLENEEKYDADEKLTLKFETKIKALECSLSQLSRQSRNRALKLTDLPNAIQTTIVKGLGFNMSPENIAKISTQVEYFEFLQKVSCKDLTTKPWSVFFQQLETFYTGKKDNFDRVFNTWLLEKCDLNVKTMQNIGKALEEYYRDKVLSMPIENIISELNTAIRMVSDWIGTDAKDLGEKIRVSKFASETVVNDALSFSKNAQYLASLKVCKNIEIGDRNSKWTLPLQNANKYITDLAKFLNFLQSVYLDFSEYHYQKDKSKYNVANLDHWGVKGKAQGIHIDKNNLKKFVKLFKGFNYIEQLDVTEFHFKLLNLVLEKTLKSQVNFYKTKHDKLVILGDFVMFSDLRHLFRNPSIKQIEIFALNTVFVNDKIEAPGVQLSIIAPKWEIIGKPVVNLDGAPGVSHIPLKAINGRFPGDDGGTGKPGLPGNQGGNFLAIGGQFIKGKNLTISVVGGRGGPGQMGGDGTNGEDGTAGSKDSPHKELKDKKKLILGLYNRVEYNYDVSGENGGTGGKGGDGGRGGIGGFGGEIQIYPLEGDPNFQKKTGNGPDGPGGEGGKGGRNGKNGKNLKAVKVEDYFLWFHVNDRWVPIEETSTGTEVCQSGGLKGQHRGEVRLEMKPTPFPSIANTVLDYKNHLRVNAPDNFQTKELFEFVDKLDSNVVIQSSYDTSSLVVEFLHLEKMHRGENLDILPFYESLLNKIRKHENHTGNKTAITRVYSATLSRIITLKRKPSESFLIIDLEKFLNNVRENIADLRDLREKRRRLKVVNQHRDAYKTEIDLKIAEALQFIESQLTPGIHEILTEVQSLTYKLMSEIKAKPKMKKFGNSLTLSNCIRLFGDVVTCFGYLGYAVACVLKAGCDAAEKTGQKNNNFFNTIQLRDGLIAIVREVSKLTTEEGKPKKKSKSNEEVEDLLPLLKNGVEFFASRFENTEECSQKQAIAPAEDVLNNFPPVHRELFLALKSCVHKLDDCMGLLNGKSQIPFEILLYLVPSQVKNFKMRVRHASTGSPIELKILHFVDKLEDAMMTMFRLYDRVQSYQNQNELAEYIAKINCTEVLDQDIAQVAKLESIIHSNLILEQHRAAVNAVAQHVFPFGSYYLKDFRLVKSVFPREGCVKTLVNDAIEEIKDLRSKVMEYKSLITSHDKFLCTGWFTGDYQSAEPFFVWGNSKYRSEISKLLSGEKVVIKADVLKGILDKDAVKFNKIGINFNSDDREIASEIRKKLDGFIVSATHLGNSYYKYGNKIFVISSGHQNITFSFEKDKSDEPVHKNVVYGKIGSGDLMLSPYAMWEFQLCPNSSKGDFRELEKYNDKVDLELIGYGSYLTKGASMSDLDVEPYYQVVQTL